MDGRTEWIHGRTVNQWPHIQKYDRLFNLMTNVKISQMSFNSGRTTL